MINTHLSYFDAVVVGIMLLSCLFAFFRGFVKEILSLGAWVGAGLITIYYFPDVAAVLEPSFSKLDEDFERPVVAAGIGTLSIYIVALLFFSLINAIILRYMKEGSDVGVLDNTLGLMFGAFRGAFIISLGYFMITMVMKEDEYPPWLMEAKTRTTVEKGAVLVARASPDFLRKNSWLYQKIEDKDKYIAGQKARQMKEEQEQAKELEEQTQRDSAQPVHLQYQEGSPAR